MAKKKQEYVHTVTRLGTVSIPIPLRRKYNIAKGSKIKFVDTNDGIKLIPLVSLRTLFGMKRESADLVRALIREILEMR